MTNEELMMECKKYGLAVSDKQIKNMKSLSDYLESESSKQ